MFIYQNNKFHCKWSKLHIYFTILKVCRLVSIDSRCLLWEEPVLLAEHGQAGVSSWELGRGERGAVEGRPDEIHGETGSEQNIPVLTRQKRNIYFYNFYFFFNEAKQAP